MFVSDFDYHLPQSLIAQAPTPQRDASRLLHLVGAETEHLTFDRFPGLLQTGDLLVVNDTLVIKARLRGEKDSGGKAELLIERIEGDREVLCQVRVSKPLKNGRFLIVDGEQLEILERVGQFYRLRFPCSVLALLEQCGETPLPPYIQRVVGPQDNERYQTVYGRHPGAVAAPTAGLHFTHRLFEQIQSRGVEIASVTLHVGAGTFQPVRVDDLGEHHMHAERYQISAAAAGAINRCKRGGHRVIAVGTTVVRTLESAVGNDGVVSSGNAETNLFITPGYTFRVVDGLLTNFHLPQSTLLMLVCAFGGHERVMTAYATAISRRYRFYSYGDVCFMERMNEF